MASYTLDPAHSHVEFVVRHMVVSKVRGAFNAFTVQLDVDESTNLPTSIQAEIDVHSIDTKVADRDTHLKSPDFFNAEKHGTIVFRSTKIEGSAESFTIDGDLSIAGTTRPVRLDASFGGKVTDPWGNERIAYEAAAKFNRKDFGLTWNQTLETGGVIVGEDITIDISLEATKTKAAAPA